MPVALLRGWDDTNKLWIPLQVDANGYVKVDMSKINLDDLADVSVASPTDGYIVYWENANSLWKCQKITGKNLSQTFGASAGRLRNIIVEPIAGEILRIANAADTAFAAKINAAGTGGLTPTNVPYDNDSREDMFKGLYAYTGSDYWGKIILHNITAKYTGTCDTDTLNELHDSGTDFTADGGEGIVAVGDEVKNTTDTRVGFVKSVANAASGRLAIQDALGNDLDLFPDGNEAYSIRHCIRKIEDVDRTTNAITTESSTDDWADNDDITCESQLNEGAAGIFEFVDIDVSDFVATTHDGIFIWTLLQDNSGIDNTNNLLAIHPYAAYNTAKRVWFKAALANECSVTVFPVKVNEQRITLTLRHNGVTDAYVILAVKGSFEFADT